MKIKSIMFFPNGNTAAFDENGNQIPQAQSPWLLEYLKSIPDELLNLDGVEITLPNNDKGKLIRTHNGYNWSII